MRKCGNCGNVNGEDRQVCGICGVSLTGRTLFRREQAERLNELRVRLRRESGKTGMARFWNSRWAAALMILLFFGLMLGLVVLLSFGSFALPTEYPANGQYAFDLIYLWLFLLLLGFVVLAKLFGMLTGDHLQPQTEKPDAKASRDIWRQPTRPEQEDEYSH